MGKQNYRDAIEKDRQEVSVLGNAGASRIAQRKAVKEKPKKTKSVLLTTLFFLFILIPVSILIYVAFFYEPNDTLTANPSSDEVSLESPIPDAPLVPVVTDEEDSEKAAAEEAKAAEAKEAADAKKAAEAKAAAEKEAAKEKEAADILAQQEADKAAAQKELAQKEQAQKEAAQAKAEKERQRAEAERQKEQAAAEQKKQEAQSAPVAAKKTHTVQQGETLYRIAVNTYGSAGASAGVEKIKAANGLNSNEITVGSTLVLP